VVGLLSFVNFLGFEKSILAVVLGLKALSREPVPILGARRSWATSAVVLGTLQVALVVTVILLNLDRIPRLIQMFRALADGI
jgi:energy-converting hydrogenase Eha subunit A